MRCSGWVGSKTRAWKGGLPPFADPRARGVSSLRLTKRSPAVDEHEHVFEHEDVHVNVLEDVFVLVTGSRLKRL
jgi:hypothetical protein